MYTHNTNKLKCEQQQQKHIFWHHHITVIMIYVYKLHIYAANTDIQTNRKKNRQTHYNALHTQKNKYYCERDIL